MRGVVPDLGYRLCICAERHVAELAAAAGTFYRVLYTVSVAAASEYVRKALWEDDA